VTARLAIMTVSFQDAYGIEGTSSINVSIDDTATLATIVANLLTLSGYFVALSAGKELGETLKLSFGTPSSEAGVGDIEKGTLWNFRPAINDYASNVFVPDVEPLILDSAGLVDLTNIAVTDFIGGMTAATGAVTPINKDARALTSFKDVAVAFRKHRKALERRTKEV